MVSTDFVDLRCQLEQTIAEAPRVNRQTTRRTAPLVGTDRLQWMVAREISRSLACRRCSPPVEIVFVLKLTLTLRIH